MVPEFYREYLNSKISKKTVGFVASSPLVSFLIMCNSKVDLVIFSHPAPFCDESDKIPGLSISNQIPRAEI